MKSIVFIFGVKNIVSLLKMLVLFNLTIGTKTQSANVNGKVWKLANITWWISSDISQFWLHHVACLDQAREKHSMDYNLISIFELPSLQRASDIRNKTLFSKNINRYFRVVHRLPKLKSRLFDVFLRALRRPTLHTWCTRQLVYIEKCMENHGFSKIG